MKKLYLLLILFISSPVAFSYPIINESDGGVYSVHKDHVIAPNGDTYVRMGNTTYAPGNTYRRYDEYTYGNDGSIYRHYNNHVIQVAPGTDNLRLYNER